VPGTVRAPVWHLRVVALGSSCAARIRRGARSEPTSSRCGPVPPAAVDKLRGVIGWIAVVIATAVTSFWAFWGILENFHEGWHRATLLENLGLMFVQYLSFPLGFLGASLLGLYLPRAGALFHVGIAAFVLWQFGRGNPTAMWFLMAPLLLLAILWWQGRARPRRVAAWILAGLPALVLVGFGAEPLWRVTHRFDDGDLGERVVEGNGVRLTWAPKGPGWPDRGVSWEEAVRRARHLSADGKTLLDAPQDLWRLPTVEEAVRSMCRGGKHCAGEWDPVAEVARYAVTPDKESPLWDVRSQVIYWWTATEVDAQRVYRIVYDGRVWANHKKGWGDYWAFRAVRAR
jgi:hypothetical protein